MKRLITILVATILVISLTGCATVLKGNTQEVTFASDPSKAEVYINGTYFGETPFHLNLDSTNTYAVEFRKSGYSSKTVLINSEVGVAWVLLDVLTGFVPVVVDALTGDWKTLDTNNVVMILQEK
jgi:hypothetical protein